METLCCWISIKHSWPERLLVHRLTILERVLLWEFSSNSLDYLQCYHRSFFVERGRQDQCVGRWKSPPNLKGDFFLHWWNCSQQHFVQTPPQFHVFCGGAWIDNQLRRAQQTEQTQRQHQRQWQSYWNLMILNSSLRGPWLLQSRLCSVRFCLS